MTESFNLKITFHFIEYLFQRRTINDSHDDNISLIDHWDRNNGDDAFIAAIVIRRR